MADCDGIRVGSVLLKKVQCEIVIPRVKVIIIFLLGSIPASFISVFSTQLTGKGIIKFASDWI